MKLKRVLIVIGLFILTFILLSFAAAMFFLGRGIAASVLTILFLASNIMIFIKGKKIAAVFGTLLMLYGLFSVGMSALVFIGTPAEIGSNEKQAIIANKSDVIDNLFQGYIENNYTIFSRDLNDNMKGRFDIAAFAEWHADFGKLTSKECLNAKRQKGGGFYVICEGEFENKRVRFNMGINENDNMIWHIDTEVMPLNLTLAVSSKKTTTLLAAMQKNETINLVTREGNVFLILNATIKNNENASRIIHSYRFYAGRYYVSPISEDYETGCSLQKATEIKADETKEGCIVFDVKEESIDGSFAVE